MIESSDKPANLSRRAARREPDCGRVPGGTVAFQADRYGGALATFASVRGSVSGWGSARPRIASCVTSHGATWPRVRVLGATRRTWTTIRRRAALFDAQELFDGRDDLRRLDGLGDVGVRAELEGALAVF